MAKDSGKSAHWSKQIAAWRASGLSRSAYCRREGIKPGTFDYWRAQLAASSQSKPAKTSAPTLVEAKRIEMPVPQPIKLKSERGWELSVPASVEPEWLLVLLRGMW
jgi:transposase-like protein